MTLLRASWFRFTAILSALLVAWLAFGFGLFHQVADRNNAMLLSELSRQLIRFTEKAVDFVVAANSELLVAGHVGCGVEARDTLKQLLLRTGSITELYLIFDTEICSIFEEGTAALPSREQRLLWLEASNPSYRFGNIENSGLLAVSWGLGTELELVAFINADPMLFGILPNQLRKEGRVVLFSGEDKVAEFDGMKTSDKPPKSIVEFMAVGSRYPLTTLISIHEDALKIWRKDIPLSIILIWCAIGLAVSTAISISIVRRRVSPTAELEEALNSGHMVPYYQPIFSLRSKKIIGCEALARWKKPDGGLVSPQSFIPLVEQYGLDWRLFTCLLSQASEHISGCTYVPPEFYVSFNVTPKQLADPQFSERLMQEVQGNIPPSAVCIEVTERQAISSLKVASENTTRLKKSGFKVAIDDAGTGHNGLASMQALSADVIKIDKFFIDHIDDDPRSRIMVDMLVGIARRYGMFTIAEGVESEDQHKVLIEAGVDGGQGFLFSKPLPSNAFVELLAEHAASFGKDAVSDEENEPDHPLDAEVPQRRLLPNNLENLPDDEVERLAALYRYRILDTDSEIAFDRITRTAKNALNVQMSAVALIDKDRRWFKSVAGGTQGEIERRHSFCNSTIQQSDPTLVPDTHLDERFRRNPLVVDRPHIRSYLGVPLITHDGYRIGSLCCVDFKPRKFSKPEVQIVTDLASMVMSHIEVRRQALHCPLTSILNRRGFELDAELQLELCVDIAKPFSIIAVDIDNFKTLNDKYGHKIGDEVLVCLSRRVESLIDQASIFGRLGGDEFILALPAADEEKAIQVAEGIRKSFEISALDTETGPITCSITLGVACSNGEVRTLSELLEKADWALYHAKELGRNRVASNSKKTA